MGSSFLVNSKKDFLYFHFVFFIFVRNYPKNAFLFAYIK